VVVVLTGWTGQCGEEPQVQWWIQAVEESAGLAVEVPAGSTGKEAVAGIEGGKAAAGTGCGNIEDTAGVQAVNRRVRRRAEAVDEEAVARMDSLGIGAAHSLGRGDRRSPRSSWNHMGSWDPC
jgi:hypothetical protein